MSTVSGSSAYNADVSVEPSSDTKESASIVYFEREIDAARDAVIAAQRKVDQALADQESAAAAVLEQRTVWQQAVEEMSRAQTDVDLLSITAFPLPDGDQLSAQEYKVVSTRDHAETVLRSVERALSAAEGKELDAQRDHMAAMTSLVAAREALARAEDRLNVARGLVPVDDNDYPDLPQEG